MSSNITHGFNVIRDGGNFVFGFNEHDNLFVSGNIAEDQLVNIQI